MNEELQDRTRRLRSDPFQSPENQLPSIPNHRTQQRSARGGSERRGPRALRDGDAGAGFGMRSCIPVPGSPSRLRSTARAPRTPCAASCACLDGTRIFKGKKQRTCGCQFSFSELTWDRPSRVRRRSGGAASAASRPCSGGFSHGLQVRVPALTPSLHPSRLTRQGSRPRGRTYRLGRCASRSGSQCHAQPRRGAPPAAGVTAARGVPLPGGDMA